MTDSEPFTQPNEPDSNGAGSNEPQPERVDTAQLLQVGRVEAESEDAAESHRLSASYATISAVLGALGLIGGLFVVWAVPFSVGAIVFAELTRRHAERNLLSRIGFITGIVGVVFAGVWAIYYALILAA